MNNEENSTIDPAHLETLSIFPLPGVVLFPGAVLPLHVFEQRYRELTRDALASTKLLAMTRLREASTPDTNEIYPIAGVGRIQSARELEDGRFLILVRGLARINVLEELNQTRSYRQIRAALRPDIEPAAPAVARATETQLVSLCDQLADTLEDSEKLRELVRLGETLGERSDLIAATLVESADVRQQLLEEPDPGSRIDRLLEVVARAMAERGVDRHLN